MILVHWDTKELESTMTALEQQIQGYFGIQKESLSKIASLFEEEHLEKGDFFIRKDQHCQKLSFIRSGYLRIFDYTDRKEVTQWISGKNYFITDLSSLLFNAAARRNIQALTDCELYSISSENYHAIGKWVPEWEYLEKIFIGKCFVTLEDRIFGFLSMSAEERYTALFQSDKELFNQVPLQYLASMLGMTPETLSRIRRNAIS